VNQPADGKASTLVRAIVAAQRAYFLHKGYTDSSEEKSVQLESGF
jgi:hypothetical protein